MKSLWTDEWIMIMIAINDSLITDYEWVNGWISEWVNKWMGEWVNGWMSEWVNKCIW